MLRSLIPLPMMLLLTSCRSLAVENHGSVPLTEMNAANHHDFAKGELQVWVMTAQAEPFPGCVVILDGPDADGTAKRAAQTDINGQAAFHGLPTNPNAMYRLTLEAPGIQYLNDTIRLSPETVTTRVYCQTISRRVARQGGPDAEELDIVEPVLRSVLNDPQIELRPRCCLRVLGEDPPSTFLSRFEGSRVKLRPASKSADIRQGCRIDILNLDRDEGEVFRVEVEATDGLHICVDSDCHGHLYWVARRGAVWYVTHEHERPWRAPHFEICPRPAPE